MSVRNLAKITEGVEWWEDNGDGDVYEEASGDGDEDGDGDGDGD